MNPLRPGLFWILSVLALGCSQMQAHSPSLSFLKLEAEAKRVELTLQLTPSDLDNDGRASKEELAIAQKLLERSADKWVVVTSGEREIRIDAQWIRIEVTDDAVVWRARLSAEPTGIWALALPELRALGPGHRQFVSAVLHGQSVAAGLLSSENSTLQIHWPALSVADGATAPLQESKNNRPDLIGFFELGIHHILTGYDHLLYLAGLVMVFTRFGRVVQVVTSFTVGHSLSLGLATLGLADLPTQVIEPLIAASIIFVGIENLVLRGREPRMRWMVALIFGLVHGFGFAGLLREIGVGQGGAPFLPPLLAFNLGVEFGQTAIVALLLPLLLWARRRPKFVATGLPLLSSLVVMVGSYWLIERVG